MDDSIRIRNLSVDDVHLWRIQLDPAPPEFHELEETLSEGERLRASNFATAELGRRWTAARGALRTILSLYMCVQPRSLLFATDAYGKPRIIGAGQPLFFNLSHTGRLAIVAIAAEEFIGVDAEMIRPDIEWEALARRVFTDAEVRSIASLPSECRIPAYFSCWTRKEAYLKALGVGLSAPLNNFQVSFRPDETARLVWVEDRPEEPQLWSFLDVGEPNMAAAVAVRQQRSTLRRFHF